MFADKGFVSHLGRAAMIAGVAAIVMTSAGPSVAAPAGKENGVTATTGTSGATDFSSQRRYYRDFAAVARLRLPPLPASWARASQSRPPIPVATTMSPTATAMVMAARPSPIMVALAPYYYGGGGYYGQRQYYGRPYDTGMRPYGGW